MTDEAKIKMMEALAKSGMSVGQLIIENTGTITYNDHRGTEKEDDHRECPPVARDTIMEYVGRLKPVVRSEYLAGYDDLWLKILELQEVRGQVYNKGKQQDTTFNRNLVAQIIHQISRRVYAVGVSDQQFAEYLEPGKGKNHSVRQKLGESPDGPVKKAVETLFVKE